MSPSRDNSPHTCHAHDCSVEIPPAKFMCVRHWYMVPEALRKALWAAYVPGQERTKTPSSTYLEVARKAINAVAAQEQPTLF